jgi:hypothetical protein
LSRASSGSARGTGGAAGMGCGLRFELGQHGAGRGDQFLGPVQEVPGDGLVVPAAVSPEAEPEFAVERRGEEQATPVETPAAEDAADLQAVEGAERVLDVDADFVLLVPHGRRLPGAGRQHR